jgi:hypothetical protein
VPKAKRWFQCLYKHFLPYGQASKNNLFSLIDSSFFLPVVMENKTAVRSDEVLTADMNWLPSADSNPDKVGINSSMG